MHRRSSFAAAQATNDPYCASTWLWILLITNGLVCKNSVDGLLQPCQASKLSHLVKIHSIRDILQAPISCRRPVSSRGQRRRTSQAKKKSDAATNDDEYDHDPVASSATSTNTATPTWNDYFLQLVDFQNIHGHTRVPKRHPGRLGEWVSRQRQRRSRLGTSQVEMLDSIGFCWNASGDKQDKERSQWWERLESIQLQVKQQSKNGNEDKEDWSLEQSLTTSQLQWLRRQRNEYIDYYQYQYTTHCKLEDQQIQALNAIDPSWWKSARERRWDVQFSVLEAYRKEHGHCNVPSAYDNRKLVNWVQNTRKKYKKVKLTQQQQQKKEEWRDVDNASSSSSSTAGHLTPEQITKLDDIGFNYDPWGQYDDKYLDFCR